MEFIKLNCPNCNGKIENKKGKTFKCPYCETELLLKENNVYFVNQSINNYYGTAPANTTVQPKTNVMTVFIVALVLICSIAGYFLWTSNQSENSSDVKLSIRSMPESEVLLFFLKDILNKGAAMPTEEEIASIRYLSTRKYEDQWHFAYSFDDPFTNEQANISDYVITDKILNTQRIEQKDFEAFSGLTGLNFMNEYEVSQSQKVSFRHLKGLKGYTGAFNESFSSFAHYFGDKAKIVELTTQIRSNAEMALLLEFPNLQSLEITYVDESVTDFHLLNQLPLKSLGISYINDIKWLSSLTGLESLTVNDSEATDFSSLYSLSQLQELKLSFVKNLKTLDFIQNMPILQSLDIQNAPITNLERLRNKQSLTKLRVSSLSQLESVDVVNSLTSLTDLSITGYYGSESTFALSNLKKAELSTSFLTKLEAPALKSLTINKLSKDLNGADLVKYPQLEQLSVMKGTFKGIHSLNSLPSLQTLNLNETAIYEETSAVFNLQHVTTINCYKCELEFNDQDLLSNNTLEHLTLNHAYFQIGNENVKEMDNVMPHFANLTGLRSFTMQDNSLQSLDFMKNWQQIEVLHLENNAISNVEPLVNLKKLQKVYILGNQVQNISVLDNAVLIY
ncbi:leucine-rich repeat domain-containing protein [Paenibacillus sp. J5C_2022]|uniref:leucine-rich repeat domain-containing protein n=1 Tax=Paenibacillus sp. J5C2022 TaxID=2977129 RepID=UPI0021D0835C|nr:leucine-rich repeat domain-containing protein [Paenibacillus sp. J5C2022]MCU6709225.1 leucine-rich repeat domain-containing protein [Paenibacillus sp. J5C2022]